WSTIWSSRLCSATSVACCTSASLFAIGRSIRGDLRLQLVEFRLARERRLEDLLQLVVPLQAATQVRELATQVQELPEWLHLLRYTLGREVVEALETEVDADLAGIGFFGEKVVDGEGEVGLHAFQHGVEVVGGDFDELAVLELRERLL